MELATFAQHGFAGARRRNDESTLAFAERREQVHYAGAGIFARGFELEALLADTAASGCRRGFVAGFVGRFEVDGFDLTSGKYFFAFVAEAGTCPLMVSPVFQIELCGFATGKHKCRRDRGVVVIGRGRKP